MFLPIRDYPNPVGTPVVNYALIAINVIVFLAIAVPLGMEVPDADAPFLEEVKRRLGRGASGAGISSYDLFVTEYGYRPAVGSPLTIFTSMFLHGGPMHLAGNMLFLWIYGDNVEARLGKLGYLAAYLASGVAATLVFAAFDMDSEVPMVGASGAISGVLGFYFVFFPKNIVKVAILLFPIFMNVIDIRARFVLGFYLLVDNLLPVLFPSADSNVAHGAHIGGFLAGLAGAFLVGGRGAGRIRYGAPEDGPHEGRASGSRFPGGRDRPLSMRPAEEQIRAFVKRGDFSSAAQVYFAAPEGTVDPAPDDALELGRWLAENGHPSAALTVFKRLLARNPSGETAAWAHLGAGYVQVQFLGLPTAAYQHFLDAIDVDPTGAAADRAREALEQMNA